ncbi:heme-binding-like protein At3g10130, chloroplastic isoform X4 [Amborella trichopoda]|uniref:heme-binding-like protein At3g10130, chloroplastic isoform X4 n=1 Tax=Amborella trichopoda TaxID=13333 RepID=UPI0005D45F9C|nr:heme-binding-like protein At3g10130, chloroplastic isoform X4 [Amborella trichopoda]|eukprot:XP_011627294.1 heme-binding-like protein At3g10130, chloroplastic isoform X4 [Amborella trichopoda]
MAISAYTTSLVFPQNYRKTFNLRAMAPQTKPLKPSRKGQSATEARLSLVFALASQTASLCQRLLSDLVTETSKYVFPRRFEARNLEEAFMSVPDLETVSYKVLSRHEQYEIREVEPYFVAETTMPGKKGFDFTGSSRAFNVLAEYLFGKNTTREAMEMTTPVYVKKVQSDGEKMEMTTPVITKQSGEQGEWQMSFVMPSKYGSNLPLPKDPSVRIKHVPGRTFAITAFSGFVTDEEVNCREIKLRNSLKKDPQFQIKQNTSVEVAQFNPPFTLPFMRRNEISLEVEKKDAPV